MRDEAYVGGRWVRSEHVLHVMNPATSELLASVPNLGTTHAVQAVDAAEEQLPAWRARAAYERSAVLRRWYELIVRNTADLARILTAEQGKPLAEAVAEIRYAASFVEWFAEEGRRIYGETIPAPHGRKRVVVIRQPVGIVGAITPWNFPSAMVTRKVAPALAAGCTVVLKPSELTPLSALALAVLAEEAGVPPGVFSVVTGDPAPIGAVLTGDTRIRKFTFTGSTSVGKMLAAKCMASVKRVSLELGGNAPFIVFDDADIDLAVEGLLLSKFRNTGQTCVCANRVLVQAGVHDMLAEKLRERVSAFVVGNGLAGDTHQGPLINEAALGKVERHVRDAIERGARVLTGGARKPGPGHFYHPTVLTGITPQMAIFREETFGPVAGLMRFETEDEAIRLANDTRAGLAAYFYTRNVDRAWRVGEALEYGMVGLNTVRSRWRRRPSAESRNRASGARARATVSRTISISR
jgi:succinate-semialdehyde dehydrogenase/glutarate-semialdehyde dehydrogenase